MFNDPPYSIKKTIMASYSNLNFFCKLLMVTIAWPTLAIIYIGIILSTSDAALQSLTTYLCIVCVVTGILIRYPHYNYGLSLR